MIVNDAQRAEIRRELLQELIDEHYKQDAGGMLAYQFRKTLVDLRQLEERELARLAEQERLPEDAVIPGPDRWAGVPTLPVPFELVNGDLLVYYDGELQKVPMEHFAEFGLTPTHAAAPEGVTAETLLQAVDHPAFADDDEPSDSTGDPVDPATTETVEETESTTPKRGKRS